VHLDRVLPGTVVHNPRSNLNNAVGYGRPARFDRVALGTDGIGADMLEEFRLAFALARADDVTTTPELPWSWLATGPTSSRGPRRPCRLVVRADGRLAPRVLARRATDPRRGRGETVLDEHGPTRVDATEIRARAAEQAVRLHARLGEL